MSNSSTILIIIYNRNNIIQAGEEAVMGFHKRKLQNVFIICLSVMMAAGFMLIFHLYLVFTNQTTIEMFENSRQDNLAKKEGGVSFNSNA